jgi:hypothetical protein
MNGTLMTRIRRISADFFNYCGRSGAKTRNPMMFVNKCLMYCRGWRIKPAMTSLFILCPFLLILSTIFVIDRHLSNGVVSGKYFWFYGSMGLMVLVETWHSLRIGFQSLERWRKLRTSLGFLSRIERFRSYPTVSLRIGND